LSVDPLIVIGAGTGRGVSFVDSSAQDAVCRRAVTGGRRAVRPYSGAAFVEEISRRRDRLDALFVKPAATGILRQGRNDAE